MAIKKTIVEYFGTFPNVGATIPVPNDWDNTANTIECIGAGGRGFSGALVSGAGGGGGGAYAKVTNMQLTPGANIFVYIGPGDLGNDVWLNKTANTPPTTTTDGILAKGGADATGTAGGSGGLAANCVGTLVYSGGNGGTGTTGSVFTGGGGGGAAGNLGTGKNGGNGDATTAGLDAGGGGGGSNGGLSTAGSAGTTAGGTGGTDSSGNTGGLGGTTQGTAGQSAFGATGSGGGGGADQGVGGSGGTGDGLVAEFLSGGFLTSVGAGGGGGGGGNLSDGGFGGNYGGGGGGGARDGASGGNGLILLTYGKTKPKSIVIGL